MSTKGFSHLDEHGRLTMVDVSDKPTTKRRALARGLLRCSPAVRDALMTGALHKGEALATAKVAAILAAKGTGGLIPLCHPLPVTDVQVSFAAAEEGVAIACEVRCVGPTGVEMEAMVAVSIAGLTLYDMAKAKDKAMVLSEVRLMEKDGGKSGSWRREEADAG